MNKSSSAVVGIDLGTTNSAVAAVMDGQVKILSSEYGPTLPSVVGLTPDETLITGTVAKNQLAAFPDRTVASIKRKMGSDTTVKLGGQEFTPPEISAMILRRLRTIASEALGQDVQRAVITVPAYFNETQRQATREAGELAGLKVERIINEPTAATLVYHPNSSQRQHIAVYDFGGGTFDVSIVRLEAGVTEVLSSQGDTALGGDDLDYALFQHVAERLRQEQDVDVNQNVQAKFRLLQACEQAKIRLSESESTTIAEEFLMEKDGQPLNVNISIDRQTLNDLIEPFVERTIDCVSRALRECSMTIQQIDDLVLVGGSTRIPLVADRLRQQFQREPSRAVDPDLAVALGAAVQGAMIQGENVGPVLIDVVTHTLGVEACVGMSRSGPEIKFVPIIRRNRPLPARFEEAFSTMFDEQEAVEVRVFQGEHEELERNALLGTFDLDLEAAGGDFRKVVVEFTLTLDGTLRVQAKQPASGHCQELVINNALTRRSESDRQEIASRLNQLFDQSDDIIVDSQFVRMDSAHSNSELIQPSAANLAKYPKVVSLLEKAEQMSDTFADEDAEEFVSLREELLSAIESDDSDTVKELTADLEDLLFYVQ
ncbi:MAG: Hsp70 family protein [Planctomycetales bacterium]|nr:Hsp70 family protein [Planctomycetales bacterium]